MSDFYQDGFDDGYGRKNYGERENPQDDCDKYSYRRGYEDGQRKKEVSDELDRELGWDY